MLKELITQAITKLPANATTDEILDNIYVSLNVQKGLEDVKNGKEITHEDFVKEINQLCSFSGLKRQDMI